MNWTAIVIFAATYLFITARRMSWLALDRPAVALLGAVACVVFGVLTPDAALGAINGPTIVLLFGVMGMGAYLATFQFFDNIADKMVAIAGTPGRLIGLIVWGSGLLSAFITNDAVCVLGAPAVVRIIQRNALPPAPFLIALATAANTGSVATLVGNPQNMLCAELGGLSFMDYLFAGAPVALFGLAINHGLLLLIYRRQLRAASLSQSTAVLQIGSRNRISLAVIGATAIAYMAGADLAFAAVSGFAALMVIHGRETRHLWNHIDWSILLFFAGLFVVVEAFMGSGATDRFFAAFPLGGETGSAVEMLRLSGIFLAGANIVSNVPFILVVAPQMNGLAEPQTGWELLAMASTFAGNLTLLGSVANIIVTQSARDLGGIGFREHLRVGAPLAILTTVVGTLWILAIR